MVADIIYREVAHDEPPHQDLHFQNSATCIVLYLVLAPCEHRQWNYMVGTNTEKAFLFCFVFFCKRRLVFIVSDFGTWKI